MSIIIYLLQNILPIVRGVTMLIFSFFFITCPFYTGSLVMTYIFIKNKLSNKLIMICRVKNESNCLKHHRKNDKVPIFDKRSILVKFLWSCHVQGGLHSLGVSVILLMIIANGFIGLTYRTHCVGRRRLIFHCAYKRSAA
uniref:Uncharacterized protein n=1 Tax=Lepeophtheirus salmonis TaxID=72036 RepID=A0A0K2TTE3_LEPSM